MKKLFANQEHNVESLLLNTFLDGNSVGIAPTGAGKTLMMCHFIDRFCKEYKLRNGVDPRCLSLVHLDKVREQNFLEMRESFPAIPSGIIKGENMRVGKQVYFSTIQSMVRFIENKGFWARNTFDLIFIDECHHAQAESYLKIIETAKKYSDARERPFYVVGITATLNRGDGKGFGDIFTNLAFKETIENLTKMGQLVPALVKQQTIFPDKPELLRDNDAISGIFKRIKNNIKNSPDRNKHIVFIDGISRAELLTNMLNQDGIGATCVHSKQNEYIKNSNYQDFESISSGVKVLINDDICTEGYNCPLIDAVHLVKQYGHKSLVQQAVGRGLRTLNQYNSSGISHFKHNCLVFDYGMNIQKGEPLDVEPDFSIPLKEKTAKGEQEGFSGGAGSVADINDYRMSRKQKTFAVYTRTLSVHFYYNIYIVEILLQYDWAILRISTKDKERDILTKQNGRNIDIEDISCDVFDKKYEEVSNRKELLDVVESLQTQPCDDFFKRKLVESGDIMANSMYTARSKWYFHKYKEDILKDF